MPRWQFELLTTNFHCNIVRLLDQETGSQSAIVKDSDACLKLGPAFSKFRYLRM